MRVLVPKRPCFNAIESKQNHGTFQGKSIVVTNDLAWRIHVSFGVLEFKTGIYLHFVHAKNYLKIYTSKILCLELREEAAFLMKFCCKFPGKKVKLFYEKREDF